MSGSVNGAFLIDKPKGYTSFDVVARMRGILHEKKIGHNGTLDPDATGLLEVFAGRATKAISLLSDHDKTYEAVLRLGISTDTEDTSGTILRDRSETVSELTEEEIRSAFCTVEKTTSQVPPMYSAKRINGKHLYELAREGKQIERQAVPIRIYALEIQEIRLPFVTFKAHVSKGTYIRTICRDIGERLQTGGCMAALRRTSIGSLRVEDAVTLDELEQLAREDRLAEVLISLDEMFSYPKAQLLPEGDRYAVNGNPVYVDEVTGWSTSASDGPVLNAQTDQAEAHASHAPGDEDSGRIRLYLSDGRFAGIYEKKADLFRPVKMFLEK